MGDDSGKNFIDRFFDAAEDLIDGTVPAGKLGFVLANGERTPEDRRTVVWHFARYKMATVCGAPVGSPKEWMPKPPGGYLMFCCRCLREAAREIENGD